MYDLKLFLEPGHLPASLKTAVLSPLLKKPSLDHEVLGNYRPKSNLNVISRYREGVEFAVTSVTFAGLNRDPGSSKSSS